MRITKNMIGEKLKGQYRPTALNSVVFFISIVPAFLIVHNVILHLVSGGFRSADIGSLIVFFVYCAISAEFNFRQVIVSEKFMYSYAPFRIYRQKLEMSEINGIKKNENCPVEVLYRDRWIVFVSNSRFEDTMDEIMHRKKIEYAKRTNPLAQGEGRNSSSAMLDQAISFRSYKTLLILLVSIGGSSFVFTFIKYVLSPSLSTTEMKVPFTLLLSCVGIASLVNTACGLQHRKMWLQGGLHSFGPNERISYIVTLAIFSALGLFILYMTFGFWTSPLGN